MCSQKMESNSEASSLRELAESLPRPLEYCSETSCYDYECILI